MSRYLRHIIKYFFSHEVTGEIATKVQHRLAHSKDDVEEAFHEIWDGLDDVTTDTRSTEEAWLHTTQAIWGQKDNMPRLYAWLRVAAIWMIPVTIIFSTYFFYMKMNCKPNYYKEVRFIHKFTAYGERELITLPDSTKVWLNSGSTLIYPSRFVSKERNVCLSGEAFFDVTKDNEHPFIVDINQIRLKVLGTSFNVHSYPDCPEVIATLETGKVEVEIEDKEQCYLLSPKDQLVYNSQTGNVNITRVQNNHYSIWRTGALYFDNTKFCHVVAQLERAYNVKIHLRNNLYDNQSIRAHFTSNESISEVMFILKMLIPSLNYIIKENEIFIE